MNMHDINSNREIYFSKLGELALYWQKQCNIVKTLTKQLIWQYRCNNEIY